MFDSLRALGPYIVILLMALVLYFRLARRGKRGRSHGRDLWKDNLARRRQERVEGAGTWEERRRRAAEQRPAWKIADRYLKPPAAEDAAGTEERE